MRRALATVGAAVALLMLGLSSCSGSSSAATSPPATPITDRPAVGQESAHSFDGTPKVGSVVGLNPGTHGTTLFGASMLAEMAPAGTDPLTYVCKACQDFYPHSTFMQRLNSTKHYPGERFAGEIQHGVTYTVISTKYDDVVTPYKSQFLLHPGVHNIVLQDGCPIDLSDHLSGLFDPRALDFITNALDERQRRQSYTIFPMDERSVEPAKRCALPQSFKASETGPRRPSTSARTSIAAASRPAGFILYSQQVRCRPGSSGFRG